MKLAVVIVNYNVKFYLAQCLLSLRRALKDVDAQVYVVDNHSRDDSIGYLRKRFREVSFIAVNHNLGFARANNLAIQQTESQYVLLLNPDTIVGEGVIKKSLAFMDEHPNAGGLGVRMLKCDGDVAMESRRGLPTPLTSFYKMCGLYERYPKSRRFAKYYMSYLSWNEAARIEVISGAYCMLRREAINKVGMLDEDYFMYGEDIDLSYRLLKGGYDNWYLPQSILHYKGESTHKSSFRYVHVFYEAMLIFFRKHYGHVSLLISLPVKTAIYLKATFELFRMQTRKIRKALGFFYPRTSAREEYIFICSEATVNKCRRLAMAKGLKSTFITRNEQSHPNGHADLLDNVNPEVTTYIVYDIDTYSYTSIFSIFEHCHKPNVLMGTYNSYNNIIITDKEIYR